MSKYVAYVGSYTYRGNSKGITILDVDVESGRMTLRKEVEVNDCSYLTLSPDQRFLYAVVDEGVEAFKILPDGDLEFLNISPIRGLRGCYVNINATGTVLAVAGYHDGKMTLLSIEKDGRVGKILYEYYNRGVGSVAERNFRPHISCATFTPDGNSVCMVDSGIDQIRVFSFNKTTRSIDPCAFVHCPLNSGPHHLKFSSDGRFAYLVSELENTVSVYSYKPCQENPDSMFEKLQTISTLPKSYAIASAACTLCFSPLEDFLFCSNAGENSVAIYERNTETGLLTLKRTLPISGDYPKDIITLPGGKHLASFNNESDSISIFTIDYKNGLLVMNGLPIKCSKPNACVIAKVE